MTLPLHHWRTIADQATKACAGFDGRFFFDAEHGDLAYIASDCDRQECDCEHNLNSDGDQDCSISVGDIDESGEPIAVILNALPAAITEIERLRQLLAEACDIGERHILIFTPPSITAPQQFTVHSGSFVVDSSKPQRDKARLATIRQEAGES